MVGACDCNLLDSSRAAANAFWVCAGEGISDEISLDTDAAVGVKLVSKLVEVDKIGVSVKLGLSNDEEVDKSVD